MNDLQTPWTPEKIAACDVLQGVKLSSDGEKVLYLVKPAYKTGEHFTSALWVADTGNAGSSRQLTSGLFNDDDAVFHPDGKTIIFLSDRHKAGGPAQLYAISLTGGEAIPLWGRNNKRSISMFDISPDGRFIAFSSEDELTPEEDRKEDEGDDAKVFGDLKSHNRLRLYSFASEDVRTLQIPKETHVHSFGWKSDSKELLFTTMAHSTLEFQEEETALWRISIARGDIRPHRVGSYPRCPDSQPIWTATEEIIEMQNFEPEKIIDAIALFTHASVSFTEPPIRLYGETEDAFSVIDLQSDDGLVAVAVAHGIETRIDVVKGGRVNYTLFRTKVEQEALDDWDAKRLDDGSLVLAVIKSSAIMQEPPNVWTGRAPGGQTITVDSKLSSHSKWLGKAPIETSVMRWKAEDGTDLEGIVTGPANPTSGPSAGLPTILLVHGGPYWRTVLRYAPRVTTWDQMLASQGYLILNPNYRGGQGRGSAFARAANGGVGTVDWTDCLSMLDEAIRRGLTDTTRTGIGGWSQGGFMTACGVTNTTRLKAGVMGAGVSDWGMMAAQSDSPDIEAALGGGAPWSQGSRGYLDRSPIQRVKDVESAVLILHGENDERVPVSQAISFMRGLRRLSHHPERHELVIYPREGHLFTERKHAEDVLKRVVEHFSVWL
ncbi:alpha/beta-hydrolase [Rickenella mellea]|uniref:Dipeptidyl-peptidase V n=1 Tax=Rickenella mellea TaxID=50990 RepID=A0A4Y7QBQ3_9AGAM|nr:alpha/beta-hydrolase [Rickenella mellea]